MNLDLFIVRIEALGFRGFAGWWLGFVGVGLYCEEL